MKRNLSTYLTVAAISLSLLATSVNAAIVVEDAQALVGSNFIHPANFGNYTVPVGTEKLVVIFGTEHQFDNNPMTVLTVTFGGAALSPVVQSSGATEGSASVWFLDSPIAQTAEIAFTTDVGKTNGGGGTAFSLSGTLPGFGDSSGAATNAVNITTTGDGSAVVAAHWVDSGTPTADAPMTQTSSNTWNNGGAASGAIYMVTNSGTLVVPTFSNSLADQPSRTAAAEFLAVPEPLPPATPSIPVPTLPEWAMILLSLLLVMVAYSGMRRKLV